MDNSLTALQVGKQVLGLDDESYQLLIKDMFGKHDALLLTAQEQIELLTRFQMLGYRPQKATPISQ